MGIILLFLCFISPHRPCLFFMYLVIFQRALPRSYDIVRIYLVLIAYYAPTHPVIATPQGLNCSTYLCSKCIQRLLLAEPTYLGDNIDARITCIFSVQGRKIPISRCALSITGSCFESVHSNGTSSHFFLVPRLHLYPESCLRQRAVSTKTV